MSLGNIQTARSLAPATDRATAKNDLALYCDYLWPHLQRANALGIGLRILFHAKTRVSVRHVPNDDAGKRAAAVAIAASVQGALWGVH